MPFQVFPCVSSPVSQAMAMELGAVAHIKLGHAADVGLGRPVHPRA
jgi:hypothetical protein